jgi:hypothetical protein
MSADAERAGAVEAAPQIANDASTFVQAAPKHVVTLESTPGSAQVFRNGVEVGETPLDIAVTAGSPIVLVLRKRGFADHSVELVSDDGHKNVTLLPVPQPRATQGRATPARAREARRERRQKSQAAPPPATASAPRPAVTESPYEKF